MKTMNCNVELIGTKYQMSELSKLIHLNFIKILSRQELSSYKHFRNSQDDLKKKEGRNTSEQHVPLKLEMGFNNRKPFLYVPKWGLLIDMLSEQGQATISILPNTVE